MLLFARRLPLIENLEPKRLFTALTFDIDPAPAGEAVLPQTYGDAVSVATLGAFRYGIDNGVTPKVAVSYGAALTNVRTYVADYGDLTNVAFGDDGNIEITLTAAAGFDVRLESFDLAGWKRTDQVVPRVEVVSGNFALYAANNVAVQGDASGPQHSTFLFPVPLVASTLTIRIFADSPFVGIDNVKFSQAATAGQFELLNGVLSILGTPGNDAIGVTATATTVTANCNGNLRTMSTAGVTRIAVDGLAGDDTVTLGTGAVGGLLMGGAGNDTLVGGAGNDSLVGNAGADDLRGGLGTDQVSYYDYLSPIYVNLDGVATDGAAGEHDNVAVDVENVLAGAGNDVLIGSVFNNKLAGNAGHDLIDGGAGNDNLLGGVGNDDLIGGVGNDVLTGNGGADFLFGGDGNDTFRSIDLSIDTINGGLGVDRARVDIADAIALVEEIFG